MTAPPPHIAPHTVRFCPLCGGALAREAVPPDGKQELVCGTCRFVFYLDRKVVAGTIPWADGRLLLTRRSIHPAYGRWTFPGGYVDWGEPVEAGAVRETLEETGLAVELAGLMGVYSYRASPVVVIVYRAEVAGGALRLCHENDCAQWVSPAEIPWGDLAFPSTRAALRDFLGRGEGRAP